jgi:hypothetical protein
VHVDDPRPVAEALNRLELKAGVPITYEDPEYAYAAEIKDVTALVRRDGNTKKRVLIPAGGVLDFEYPVDGSGKVQEQTPDLVHRLLKQYANGATSTFTVQADGDALHVIPAMVRNKRGEFVSTTPLLDNAISIPSAQRNGFEMLSAICDELTRVSGHRVFVATVPLKAIHAYRAEMGADNERARVVLGRVVQCVSRQLSWRLLYDPGLGWYALNIHAVPPNGAASQRVGSVPTGAPPRPTHTQPTDTSQETVVVVAAT